jgi:hypothetical protein
MEDAIGWLEVPRHPVVLVPRSAAGKLTAANQRLRTDRQLLAWMETAPAEGTISFAKEVTISAHWPFHIPTPVNLCGLAAKSHPYDASRKMDREPY